MKPFLDDLTAEYVRSILDYDPTTGVFVRKHRVDKTGQWNGRCAGRPVTSRCRRGYLKLSIDGRLYRSNRVAWLIMTDEWPARLVDHRDTNTSNDRWENLRLATPSQSGANRNLFPNNTSGLKGVSWIKTRGHYRASIMHEGRYIHIATGQCAPALHFDYLVMQDKLFKEFARSA